jgi:glycosyltransferase involved in cell wall biosynthesis
MRVISVQPHFRAGGAEMQTLLLSNELAGRGIETHLVLHNAVGEMLGELSPAVTVHDLGLESHAALPVISARLARKLGEFDGGLVILKLWASLFAAAPTSLRHGPLLFATCEDLDPTKHWQVTKFGRAKKRIVREIFRRSRLVTANTESVADAMVATYELERRPDVIYGGVDVPRVRRLAEAPLPATPAGDDGAIRIVTVASLRERKGHPNILAGLIALDRPWTWDVVGDGPELEAVKRLVPAELRDRVRFRGATPNPYPYIAAADLMVHLPSSEAFGIAILEALALGVPVVSSPSIGPLEISRRLDPVRRYLSFADPTDPPGVAERILAAVDSGATPPADLIAPFNVVSTADHWLELARRNGTG